MQSKPFVPSNVRQESNQSRHGTIAVDPPSVPRQIGAIHLESSDHVQLILGGEESALVYDAPTSFFLFVLILMHNRVPVDYTGRFE